MHRHTDTQMYICIYTQVHIYLRCQKCLLHLRGRPVELVRELWVFVQKRTARQRQNLRGLSRVGPRVDRVLLLRLLRRLTVALRLSHHGLLTTVFDLELLRGLGGGT